MSGLDVSGHAGHGGLNEHASPIGSYSSQEDLGAAASLDSDLHNRDSSDDQCGTSTYPSPSSTVSPGGSPHAREASPPALPISRSSELAYALQNNSEQVTTDLACVGFRGTNSSYVIVKANDGNKESHTQYNVSGPPHADADSNNASQHNVPYFYDDTGAMYPPNNSSSSSSSLSLPMLDYSEKFHFNGGMAQISSTGHYHNIPPYSSSEGASFSAGEGREGLDHAMEFASSSYSAYHTEPVDTSAVASQLENTLHSVDSFAPYTR